jgi:hypothetical protein
MRAALPPARHPGAIADTSAPVIRSGDPAIRRSRRPGRTSAATFLARAAAPDAVAVEVAPGAMLRRGGTPCHRRETVGAPSERRQILLPAARAAV